MSRAGRPEIDELLHEMIAPAAESAPERARRRRLTATAATVGLALLGVTSLTTSALFTDNDSLDGGTFTTGTLKVGLAPSETFLEVGGLVPGDVRYQPLVVRNDGSLGYRYAVEKTVVDAGVPLSEKLQLTAYAMPDPAACTADGVAALEPVRATAPLSADGAVLLGDRSTGQHPGDRSVVSGGSEVLCFQVALPLDTDDTYQASSTTVTLTVLAEQLTNND